MSKEIVCVLGIVGDVALVVCDVVVVRGGVALVRSIEPRHHEVPV